MRKGSQTTTRLNNNIDGIKQTVKQQSEKNSVISIYLPSISK